MRAKVQKLRCVKRQLEKSDGICRTYDAIHYAGADYVNALPEVKSFRCNVLLTELEEGEFTSDFVATLTNGDIRVYECVKRENLTKPKTAHLLEASRSYWLKHGVTDWRLIVNEA